MTFPFHGLCLRLLCSASTTSAEFSESLHDGIWAIACKLGTCGIVIFVCCEEHRYEKIKDTFVKTYGKQLLFCGRAPGRVNLIGKHSYVMNLLYSSDVTYVGMLVICEYAIAYAIAYFGKKCKSHIFPHMMAFSKSHMRKIRRIC